MASTLNGENISPQVLRQVAKEIGDLVSNPPEGIKVTVSEEDITDIHASIQGPASTPYEGGVFRMKLVLPSEFPAAPPKGFFLTKIFHPNISKNGEICVNTLKKDWKPDMGIKHVLVVVKCLLINPNPESALNEEAGKMLLEQYDDFAKHAKMMTEIHAKPLKEDEDGESDDESPVSSSDGSSKKRAVDLKAAKLAAKDKKGEKDKKKALKRL